ncbi:hypothetical protein TNIN_215621 [Trichonephila inaurata madagascariensis]|uniref:Uncharacterized protein n=1 Tax=Trichonephila inaurata madagascariensis TaxID=2747483 RepID=A0A8X7C700_9ARAC|nr:hypothetical protein TNIN_215621 [Trichonephila inaurata madagascariensis]
MKLGMRAILGAFPHQAISDARGLLKWRLDLFMHNGRYKPISNLSLAEGCIAVMNSTFMLLDIRREDYHYNVAQRSVSYESSVSLFSNFLSPQGL